MGSSLYTYSQAAERLGRTKKTVQTYVKQGFIRKEIVDGSHLLAKEDVEQMVEDKGVGQAPLNRKTFYELCAKVRRIEEVMEMVKQILDLESRTMRLDRNMAIGMYQAATASLASGSWRTEEIELWIQQFLQFDETTLDDIGKHVPDLSPWRPFFQLCIGMQNQVARDHSKSPSLETERLHDKLERCRARLRQIAVVWVELGKGTTQDTLLRALDNDKENLLKKISDKTSKSP